MVVLLSEPDPFRGMWVRWNSTDTRQSGYAPRSGTNVKNRRSCAKDGALEEAQTRDYPERGKLDTAVDVRKSCKKKFPSVLFCIDKRTKEDCDRGSEV